MAPPGTEETKTRLLSLRAEIAEIAAREPTISSGAFTSWESRTRSALTRAVGAQHHITEGFLGIHWTPQAFTMGDRSAFASRFQRAAQEAQGYIDAAVDEVESLSPEAGAFDAAGVDPELWAFVGGDIEDEHWGRAASQTMLFVEDRIRRWTGQPAELVGEKLMTAVFGDSGDYRLGLTTGEKQGWHRLAMGMSMALRNVVAHRIQDRDDHRRYTLGVLGVGSLLLTQLRYEHGNRFHDLSPATPQEDSAEES